MWWLDVIIDVDGVEVNVIFVKQSIGWRMNFDRPSDGHAIQCGTTSDSYSDAVDLVKDAIRRPVAAIRVETLAQKSN
jgi:hypothetical protein